MIIAIDKPRGWTSFDVIKKVRSISGERKVGHAGTLDPFAEGILVLGIGRDGTKKLTHLALEEKEYVARLKLGLQTDTLDPDGQIVKTAPVPELTAEKITKIFHRFTGNIEQIPPMYSAKKVDGTRLYKLARQKLEVPRRPATVEIKSLTLNSFSADTIDFSVTCSKGTYVRQLGADVASALGTVGYLVSLKRIRAGNFVLDDCRSLEELSEVWLSIAE